MSKIEVNTVEPQCGTTLTLGGSGDTVTLGSGASQSGFGRTGTVDWQTGSIKTATFTAANGEGYFANTSGGAFTMNLPAGTAGNIVSVVDYTNTFQTNNLTVSPNGSQKIGGVAEDAFLTNEGQSVTFVYVDDTEGWKNVQDSTSNVVGNQFIIATGGTITTSGNCKIHTFTGPGTFCVSRVHPCAANNLVSYVVAGGGAGGGWDVGGGGGAGGYRETKSPVTPYIASPLNGYGTPTNRITVTATAFPITVGAGGAGSPAPNTDGVSGGVSTFSTITSAGGGGGGGHPVRNGVPGGSGGGGAGYVGSTTGGSGNTPSVTPPQGQNGGSASSPGVGQTGGGGGGAGGVGSNSVCGSTSFAPGGPGVLTEITSAPVTYSAGGRGGGDGAPSPAPGGANTANGGDGAGGPPPSGGGSGIVIIRYKFQ